MILVKNISSLSEARYCAGMSVDFITFDFNPESESFVESSTYNEIKKWVIGIKILGNGNFKSITEIQSLIDSHNLDGFLFTENQIDLIDKINCEFKFVEIPKNSSTLTIVGKFDGIILSGYFNEKELITYNNKILLAGFDFENIKKDLKGITGFAFKGSKELQPGQNNYDDLMDALEYLDENHFF